MKGQTKQVVFIMLMFWLVAGFAGYLWDVKGWQDTQVVQYLKEIIQLTDEVAELEEFYQAPEEFIFVVPIPVEDYKAMSSYFGYRNDPLRKNSGSTYIKDHPSLDLTGVIGARTQSVGYGVIENKWYDKGYHNGRWYRGNDYFNGYVQVRLDNGMLASYGHVFEIIVYEGNRVIPGQDLARIDPRWSPLTTGPHLHFSLQDADDNFLQPQKYIEFDKFPYTSRKNTESIDD